jgi:uncharacterized membrane protein YidH (DUF202 family)
MPDRSSIGTLLILSGLALLAVGALVWSGALSWFGRLPGDIRFERPGTRVYVPITSMILVSLLLTLVMSVARRFWS